MYDKEKMSFMHIFLLNSGMTTSNSNELFHINEVSGSDTTCAFYAPTCTCTCTFKNMYMYMYMYTCAPTYTCTCTV